jgi:phage gpG-like protein
MNVTINIDDAAVRRALATLQQRIGNLAPVMRRIGDTLKNDALDNFKGQHTPEGKPWPRLRPATLIARARRLSGGKGLYTKGGKGGAGKRTTAKAYRTITQARILQDRGQLRASIRVLGVGPTHVEVGSQLPHAAIHQFGGKAGKGRQVFIPARPFIGMSAGAERDIIDTINAYLGTHQR